jgi:hypothetical protein
MLIVKEIDWEESECEAGPKDGCDKCAIVRIGVRGNEILLCAQHAGELIGKLGPILGRIAQDAVHDAEGRNAIMPEWRDEKKLERQGKS